MSKSTLFFWGGGGCDQVLTVLFLIVCPGDGGLQGLFYENSSVGNDVPEGCEAIQLDAVYKTSS